MESLSHCCPFSKHHLQLQNALVHSANVALGRFSDGHIIDRHIIDGHIIDGTFFQQLNKVDIFSTTK